MYYPLTTFILAVNASLVLNFNCILLQINLKLQNYLFYEIKENTFCYHEQNFFNLSVVKIFYLKWKQIKAETFFLFCDRPHLNDDRKSTKDGWYLGPLVISLWCWLVAKVATFSNCWTLCVTLSAPAPTKWSNTLKQFVGNSRRIVWECLTILWCWHLQA